MSLKEYEELIFKYSENLLSEEKKEKVIKHLKNCKECKKFYDELSYINENFKNENLKLKSENLKFNEEKFYKKLDIIKINYFKIFLKVAIFLLIIFSSLLIFKNKEKKLDKDSFQEIATIFEKAEELENIMKSIDNDFEIEDEKINNAIELFKNI